MMTKLKVIILIICVTFCILIVGNKEDFLKIVLKIVTGKNHLVIIEDESKQNKGE